MEKDSPYRNITIINLLFYTCFFYSHRRNLKKGRIESIHVPYCHLFFYDFPFDLVSILWSELPPSLRKLGNKSEHISHHIVISKAHSMMASQTREAVQK